MLLYFFDILGKRKFIMAYCTGNVEQLMLLSQSIENYVGHEGTVRAFDAVAALDFNNCGIIINPAS